MVGRRFRKSGSCRKTLPEVRRGLETLLEFWKWSEDPPGGPEVVGRPSHRSGSGQEKLPEVQKWSRDPLGGSEVVGKPFRRSGRGQETLSEVRKWSEDTP